MVYNSVMAVQVEIPDQVFTSSGGEISRRVLETVALEGFKSGKLTIFQIRQLLGFETRFEVHEFLAEHDVPWVNYSVEDLEKERRTLRELLGK
ncbi:hypothetical protein BH20ACI2_BH20ACI2_22770 [soil metagenome]